MNGLVLLITIVRAVWVLGSASRYFVRMPYPNPAGVTYTGITPYRSVVFQSALPPLIVSSPATALATARPVTVVTYPESIPKIAISGNWQQDVNHVNSVNDTACNDERCNAQKLAQRDKVNIITSKSQDNVANSLETRFNGIQQNPALLDLNYPVCYLPVDNSIFSPLIQVPSFGLQPTPIQEAPFIGLPISSGPIFTPHNPSVPFTPSLGFQPPDFLPQIPSVPFLPPQIPSYPTLATPAPPASLPNKENDDTDSVVIENPELERSSNQRNLNTDSQIRAEPQESTESYDKQIVDEFKQRQSLRASKKQA